MEEGEHARRRLRWRAGAMPLVLRASRRFPGLQQLKGLESQVLVPFGEGRVHFLKEARNPILLGLFDGLFMFGLSQFQSLRPGVRLLFYVGEGRLPHGAPTTVLTGGTGKQVH